MTTDPQAWRAAAACRGSDPAMWFPGRGDDLAPLKAICAGWPVRLDCLEYGISLGRGEPGVYGGESERGRRRIRAERRRQGLAA